MAHHEPEGELTWYRGSIRPYASLWHTLVRLGSLNRLSLSQIPDRPANIQGGRRADRNTWYPLFNEANEIDTNELAIALGESASSLRWSHLGNVVPWIRSHFTRHLRFCKTCLSLGYHSSLYSLKLLDACPIHGEPLFDGCPCGTVIGNKLTSANFRQYGHCTCGTTTFIDPENCRDPKIAVQQTQALDNIAVWLQELAALIKPVDYKVPRFSSVVTPAHLDVATWCDAFEIRYPENLIKSVSHRRLLTIAKGGPFHGAAPQPAKRTDRSLGKYWREDSPATWTYRSICRYLRRHGVSDDSRIGRKDAARYKYANAFGKLLQEPKFAAAYTEAQWARHLEPNVCERRWPYRDPWADPNQKFIGQLELFGAPDWRTHQNIAQSTRTWLEYHWAAYCMLCIWAHYKDRTDRIISVGNEWLIGEHIALPNWDWAAKVQPDGSALFACLNARTSIFPARCHKPKSARIREQQILELQRAKAVQDACKGPCLTWSQRDDWNVTTAVAPGSVGCKRHTLLGSFKERPKFWLFPTHGGYIARLETVALQVADQSPRDAISLLRSAYAQYERTFPTQERRTAEKHP